MREKQKQEHETETEREELPKLKLPYLPLMHSPDNQPSGSTTPPLHTSASVPFKWEEQPGKPRPCTDIIILQPEPEKLPELHLPPSRLHSMDMRLNNTKTQSPTTVLNGPYDHMGRPKFSSFRFFLEAHDSLSSSSSSIGSPDQSTTGGDFDRSLLSSKKQEKGGKGYFGSLRFTLLPSSNNNINKNIASVESEEMICGNNSNKNFKGTKNNITANYGSSSNVFHDTKPPHLWATIYGGIKQAIPWKTSKKSKKQVRV